MKRYSIAGTTQDSCIEFGYTAALETFPLPEFTPTENSPVVTPAECTIILKAKILKLALPVLLTASEPRGGILALTDPRVLRPGDLLYLWRNVSLVISAFHCFGFDKSVVSCN